MFAFGELSSLISLLAAEFDETAQELTQTQDKLAIANAEIVGLKDNGGLQVQVAIGVCEASVLENR